VSGILLQVSQVGLGNTSEDRNGESWVKTRQDKDKEKTRPKKTDNKTETWAATAASSVSIGKITAA
jgi:hypothetical protein